jgi:transcriptional regulator
MYAPSHFALRDKVALHEFLRTHVFATFAGVVDDEVHLAYVPTVLDADHGPFGALRFHFARANPLARVAEGARLKFSVLGAHSYISPDWYETKGQVPTWNYIAVEGSGSVARIGEAETSRHLAELASQEETALLPKPKWTIDRVDPERFPKMLTAIVGFQLLLDSLEGKAKLSQNRSTADRGRVIAAMEARGDHVGLAVARAMREYDGEGR